MGKIEENVRSTNRRAFIKRAILASVQAAGILAVAAVAPNVFVSLQKLGLLPRDGRYAVRRSLGRLLESGYMEMKETKGKKYFLLTRKGRIALALLEAKNFKLKKPKRWDGKFRILIFDVAEKRRYKRDRLRFLLRQMGFERIQQSVWAYPYDCEDIIQLVKTDLGVGKEVLYLVTGDIENKQKLITRFGLK